MSENDKWTLLPSDQIAKMSRKELRGRIRGFIELAERGPPHLPGGMELLIIRAQYLTEELARRNQNRQTRWIIAMTAAIMIMTAAIMAATLWPPEVVRSTVHSLLIRVAQVIDLWPWWPRRRATASKYSLATCNTALLPFRQSNRRCAQI